MKIFKLIFPVFLLVAIVSLNACSEDPDPVVPEVPEEAKTTYTADVSAIFVKCNFPTCHNNNSTNGKVGTYADAKAFAEGGRMVGAIKHEDGFEPMPSFSPKLSDESIATIEKWISDGLLE